MRKHKFKGARPGPRKSTDSCKKCNKTLENHDSDISTAPDSVQSHHVVMFSGGIGSFCAAERVKASASPQDKITLLFTDTLMEDEDLYRFLIDSEKALKLPITRISDGRTPWQVFKDVRYLGNSRIDPCSKILKRDLAINWLKTNCDPAQTVCYLGIDWSEEHRYLKAKARHAEIGWTYKAPMCEAPYLTKKDMLARLKAYGIRQPRLYDMGFPHNNCGGFCIKAGKSHFKLLLEKLPDRYKYHESEEESLRQYLNKDVTILKEQVKGESRRLPLAALRQRLEGGEVVDKFDWGGCGCFLDADVESDSTPAKLTP